MKYTDGDWYVNGNGNIIYYIERNPCRCCPDSYYLEYQPPYARKLVKFDIFSTDHFNEYSKKMGLKKL